MGVDVTYPNAPVVLVTMEIRHPATDSLTASSSGELRNLLVDDLPIERQAEDVAWAMGVDGNPTPTAERFVRYLNNDSTVAVTIKPQAIVVETSAYSDFAMLLDLVMRVADARAQVSSITGVERLGLRYILEVRAPVGVDGRVEWANWIAEPLLGPRGIAPAGLILTEWQGAAVYQEAQPGKSMIVRYGPGMGQALDPNYHLRRTIPVQTGPFFLLDIDSFWTPARSIPEYNRVAVLNTFQWLYEPMPSLFQEMLGGGPNEDLLNP